MYLQMDYFYVNTKIEKYLIVAHVASVIIH